MSPRPGTLIRVRVRGSRGAGQRHGRWARLVGTLQHPPHTGTGSCPPASEKRQSSRRGRRKDGFAVSYSRADPEEGPSCCLPRCQQVGGRSPTSLTSLPSASIVGARRGRRPPAGAWAAVPAPAAGSARAACQAAVSCASEAPTTHEWVSDAHDHSACVFPH